jgi:hypothetical protein
MWPLSRLAKNTSRPETASGRDCAELDHDDDEEHILPRPLAGRTVEALLQVDGHRRSEQGAKPAPDAKQQSHTDDDLNQENLWCEEVEGSENDLRYESPDMFAFVSWTTVAFDLLLLAGILIAIWICYRE